MKKVLNPLSFLSIGDKLEGRFPLFSSPAPVEKDDSRDAEGIVVWPPEDSTIIESGEKGTKAARALWN
ncbi:MAG: hypothetical protein NTU47_02300 [Ignavibacteriales bacterium]|nr:hypothetical protein [Ignavibacteriales bacterium]